MLVSLIVCRGVYKKEPCAVKLIFTTDLTEEVISRVMAEASLLSAAKVPPLALLSPSLSLTLPWLSESQHREDHRHLCAPSQCVFGVGALRLWLSL